MVDFKRILIEGDVQLPPNAVEMLFDLIELEPQKVVEILQVYCQASANDVIGQNTPHAADDWAIWVAFSGILMNAVTMMNHIQQIYDGKVQNR